MSGSEVNVVFVDRLLLATFYYLMNSHLGLLVNKIIKTSIGL